MPKIDIRQLAEKVHALKPVVMIGNKGLTPAVQAEINVALDHHELIKIKIAGGDKEARNAIIGAVCTEQNAILIKKIGHIFAIFRARKD